MTAAAAGEQAVHVRVAGVLHKHSSTIPLSRLNYRGLVTPWQHLLLLLWKKQRVCGRQRSQPLNYCSTTRLLLYYRRTRLQEARTAMAAAAAAAEKAARAREAEIAPFAALADAILARGYKVTAPQVRAEDRCGLLLSWNPGALVACLHVYVVGGGGVCA